MIGGIIAGAGALIGGSMIASSNREASIRAFQASDNFRRTYDACSTENAHAIKKLGKGVEELNETFDDEFNNNIIIINGMHPTIKPNKKYLFLDASILSISFLSCSAMLLSFISYLYWYYIPKVKKNIV